MTTIPSTTWTLDKLVALTHEDALALFRSLPSVDFAEMQGEYSGHIPDGGDPSIKKSLEQGIFNEETPFGCWLGKAVRQLGPSTGEGYNYCRKPGGKIVRHLRYGTSMATSWIDGQTVFTIKYAEFNNASGERDLTDEVRNLRDGLYLCISTTRADDGGRSNPGVFILAGPEGPWVGVDDETLEKRLGRSGEGAS